MDLVQFMTWLASAGGATAAFSFVCERVPAFQALPSQRRALLSLGGSLGIALISWGVLNFTPPHILAQIAPAFQVAYGVTAAWIANQVAHSADPGRKSGALTIVGQSESTDDR